MKHKNSILVLLGVLCLILVGAVVYTAFIRQPDAVETDSEASEGSGGRYITYKGKEYRRDQNVQALLLMGVDRESTAQVGEQTGDAGQADSLNLLILNKKEQTAKILQISRDSAVDIDVYDENGSKVMTAEGQLCLQYAFGDGGGRSCRLTVEKTEELLGGIDIDSYLALTLDGIKVAVDAAGGIPITVPEDYTWIDPAFQKGASLVLNGEQAEQYVRSRDTETLDSNQQRMERQSQFMRALLSMLAGGGFSTQELTDLYQQLEPYMTTNLTADELTQIAGYTFQEETQTVPGEVTEQDGRALYITDAEKIQDLIINEFFIEK